MSRSTLAVNDAILDYLHRVGLRECATLRALREETAALPQAGMQIAPEQGQFLTLLTELIGARRTLEVGVFTGYSSICVARALPPDGHLIAMDVSEEWTRIARRYWDAAGVADRIELRLAPALETLDGLIAGNEAGRFDMAFVDADKENYESYYERVLLLVRPGGLIAFDNTLWSGRVADPGDDEAPTVAIRALNMRVHGDERVTMCQVPIGDGLLLARKR